MFWNASVPELTVTLPVKPFEPESTSVPGFAVVALFRMKPDVPSRRASMMALPPPMPLTVITGVVPLPAFSVSVLPMVPPLEISHEPVLLVVVSPNDRLPSV